ncbi:MAG: NRDE family protein [Hyphomonadaceae bacterium]
MCTLTICRDHGRVLVTMNRDDVTTREEASPTLWPGVDPAFIAPKDLQAGGTWIGVNRYGVIACLLNRYDSAPVGRTSRGAIVIEALRGQSAETASDALFALEHRAYSPFTCMLITDERAERFDWNGSHFERTQLPTARTFMATSSSWRFDEVHAQREALFKQVFLGGGDVDDSVAAFHAERVSEGDAWAPMMSRPQSQTKSVTQVEIKPGIAEMRYWTREAAISRRLTSPEASTRIDISKAVGAIAGA